MLEKKMPVIKQVAFLLEKAKVEFQREDRFQGQIKDHLQLVKIVEEMLQINVELDLCLKNNHYYKMWVLFTSPHSLN
jgi:hypothetical protein